MLEKEVNLTIAAGKPEEMDKDRKAFMEKCMAAGKSMEECAEEGEKKYPALIRGRLWKKEEGVYFGFAPNGDKEKLGEYVIRRWTWKEKQTATMEAANIIDAARGLAEMNIVDYEIESMKVCVKKSPIPLSDAFFEDLDPDIGDILIQATRIVNGLPPADQTSFLGQSEQDKVTPG